MTYIETDYLKIGYHPKDDIICLFRIEPGKDMSLKEAAEHVALESSTGTWVGVGTAKNYMKNLNAKIFNIENNFVKIAYPSALFEKGNAPNILSSIAGNIFGMKSVKNLRLEDVSFPSSLLKSFPGPYFGISGLRKMMDIKTRPFLGTIIKPKLGLRTEDHAKSAYESWIGGCDFVKDDENLASQDFNKFEARLSKTLEMADKAEQITGEKKAYLVNVTAETNEMIRRAELVKKQGGKYVMIDFLTAGFSGLQTLREANLKIPIHAHRAMHAAMTRNKKHGIAMIVLADFARLIGVDTLHIGTGIGKLEGNIKDILEIEQEIENEKVKETHTRLKQDWGKINSTMAVCSGGLHPGHIPFLIKHLGNDIVIQMGGGIHGNKLGTSLGAKAAREMIDLVINNYNFEEFVNSHLELKATLRQFVRR